MYLDILESLGLSPNEAKIYEALVERGESSMSDIAVAAKVHRRNAYDAVNRLIEKGLCFQIFSTTENRYSAVDPDKLQELVAERQQRLESILPSLKKKFRIQSAREEAYIYRGFEGLKNVWRETLRVGKDTLVLGAKAQWFDPRVEASRVAFLKEAQRKKLSFYLLLDHEVPLRLFGEGLPPGFSHRFLPEGYSTTSVIQTFGDYVVTYTGASVGRFDENTVIFIIRSKNLAESYRVWFWYMWKRSAEGPRKKR